MEKFNKTLRGYNPKEVNAFLDEVIGQVEKMVSELREKEKKITELELSVNDGSKSIALLNKTIAGQEEQINRYKALELTLNKTIVVAQDSGEQIRRMAKQEGDFIVNEARGNANRIVNDALLRAEKLEFEISNMRKNVSIFKKKLGNILDEQRALVDDIEILDLNS